MKRKLVKSFYFSVTRVYSVKNSLFRYIRKGRLYTVINAVTIKEIRQITNEWKKEGLSIGFVPTMGYLHEGHKSLIDRSVAENDRTVVSIFVNPMQFGPAEDLAVYPRDAARDASLCEASGTDLIIYAFR